MKKLNAYKTLKPATKRWINSINKSYELETYHQRLLVLCGMSWDRCQEAREVIEAEGSYIFDRFEQRKPHPAIEVQKQAMLVFTRILRELGLDLNTEDNRPASGPGGY